MSPTVSNLSDERFLTLCAVADLFLLLHNTPDAPHGQNGVFFAQPAEYTRRELAQAIGQGLVATGKMSDGTPTSFTIEELDQDSRSSL